MTDSAALTASSAGFGAEDLARGLLGGVVPRLAAGAAAAGDEGRSIEAVAAANAVNVLVHVVTDQIEAAHPGRLAALENDTLSGEPARMIAAKRGLEAAIAEAIATPAILERATERVAAPLLPLDPAALRPLTSPSATVAASCPAPTDALGRELHLGAVLGRYGDERIGFAGAVADAGDLVSTSVVERFDILAAIDAGRLVPDRESRLGAYASTRGYAAGTTGSAVHSAIGTIYLALGDYGQEKIGRVFGSAEAKALFPKPVTSCAGLQMATLENRYWSDVAAEDGLSAGGQLGAAFNPTARDFLQQHVFSH